MNSESLKHQNNHETVLKEYYARYLTDVRGLKKSTVLHYFDALNNISRRLKEKGLVRNDIYEVADLEQLKELREILFHDEDFIIQNERGKRMYSAGMNNYYRFASGDGFKNAQEKLYMLDIPIEPEAAIVIEKTIWKRSGILRTQAIEFAGYACELDNSHETFISGSTGKPYMEGHHALPMNKQEKFHVSLDVYANIICLCPMCHRRIHYGVNEERRLMVRQIYEARSERLLKSGIRLSKDEFVEFVV